MRLFKKLFSFFWDRSLLIFLIIGGLNTLVSMVGSQLLYGALGYWGATALMFTVCSVFSFIFNRKYSFESKAPLLQRAARARPGAPCRSGAASRKNGAAGQRKSKGRFVPICYGRHFRRILLAARRGQAEVRKSDYDEQIARAFLRRCGRYRPFLCGDQNACGRQSAH